MQDLLNKIDRLLKEKKFFEVKNILVNRKIILFIKALCFFILSYCCGVV